MERNTVNIDLVDYNELLIKAEKYDEMKGKERAAVNTIDVEKIRNILNKEKNKTQF